MENARGVWPVNIISFVHLFPSICVPLSAADVADAAKWAPLETRTDRQLHGPIWQRRGDQWYQCKSWISRQFFF